MPRAARVAEIRRLLRESRNSSLAEGEQNSRAMGLADSAIAQSEELLAGVRALARRPRSFVVGEDVGVSVNTTVDVDGSEGSEGLEKSEKSEKRNKTDENHQGGGQEKIPSKTSNSEPNQLGSSKQSAGSGGICQNSQNCNNFTNSVNPINSADANAETNADLPSRPENAQIPNNSH